MLFNSFNYIVFFAVVVTAFYIIPDRFRYLLLLGASCIFYMAWRPELIALILLSSFVNFYASVKIGSSRNEHYRKRLLIASMIFNFGLLFVFKYLVFINRTLISLFAGTGSYPFSDFSILLPMGISFYTFQAAGYTIDVYRGDLKPEKNYLKFTLFITFFPQLVAGPIERASNLMSQLFTAKRPSLKNFETGVKYMAFGFFKKIVIADRLAMLVDSVYNSPKYASGLSLTLATVLFGFQIYCDFSGYSDIAVGSAKFLGIDLMQNFRQPYISKSVREFWRRWHISLSGWFKDYLYIPLGGSRVSKPRYYFNVMVTFLVSGIWHGANWTFVIWGALHGMYQIIESVLKSIFKRPAKIYMLIAPVITFILVMFAWVFFRANSVSDAAYIIGHMFDGAGNWIDLSYIYQVLNTGSLGLNFFEITVSVALVIFLLAADAFAKDSHIVIALERSCLVIRFLFYFIIAAALLCLGVFYNAGEFIYFQF